MSYYWDRFLQEGDELFDYMIHNFENMFDGKIIKHFEIMAGICGYIVNFEKMNDDYNTLIQSDLVDWIIKEFEENRLFDKTQWKPFCDSQDYSIMYFGYKKLFKYKQYYFQLGIEDECLYKEDGCKYCMNNEKEQHFLLALYGWIDDTSDKLQPYKRVNIPETNIMPDRDWLRK